MEKILNQIKFNWTKDEIIRFLYIKLAPLFKRDLKYFLLSNEEQKQLIENGLNVTLPNVICITLVEFYHDLFKKFNIESEIITANTNPPLYILAVLGDYGYYYLDFLNDLFRNQYGLKPLYFGIKPTFKSLKDCPITFTNLPDSYLYSIDKKLKLFELDMYLNCFIEELHKTFAVRSKISRYFNVQINDYYNIIVKKLSFYNQYLLNLGQVNCIYERSRLYSYLNSRLLDREERKHLNVNIEINDNKPVLALCLDDSKYIEEFKDNQYILKKIR